MKRKLAGVLLATLMLTPLALAENGVVIRSTELKEKPFADASTLATLGDGSAVVIVARQSGWMQVQASGKTGWVKMLSVRTSASDAPASGQGVGGLLASASAFKTGSSGSSTNTAGVKGLSEDDLRKASPNAAQLSKMQGFAVSADEAGKYAKQVKLASQRIDYLPAPDQVKRSRTKGDN